MRALSEQDTRFAERLPTVRRVRGLTQEQVAATVGINRSAIAEIETGRRGVRLGEALDLCAALGVDLAEMCAPGPLTVTVATRVA